MTEKKKYIKPQTEVLDLRIPSNVLASMSLNMGDAKETSFDDEEEEEDGMYEDNFPGWGD